MTHFGVFIFGALMFDVNIFGGTFSKSKIHFRENYLFNFHLNWLNRPVVTFFENVRTQTQILDVPRLWHFFYFKILAFSEVFSLRIKMS